jgi:hypothetical protein
MGTIVIKLPNGTPWFVPTDVFISKGDFVQKFIGIAGKTFPQEAQRVWTQYRTAVQRSSGTDATMRREFNRLKNDGIIEPIPEYELTEAELYPQGRFGTSFQRSWYRLVRYRP